MRIARFTFFLFFTLYMFFPDSARNIGFGSAGLRVLFLDVLVFIMILASIKNFLLSFIQLTKMIPITAIIFFSITIIISILRGLPNYGGFTIGEARWFLLSILILVGFSYI